MKSRTAGSPTASLFAAVAREQGAVPLAERMRPKTISEYAGQAHVLGPKAWLRQAIEADRVPSLILWGPPGVGKTTLARLLAAHTRAEFVAISAVLSTVAEFRELTAQARERRDYQGRRTLLFVDEIHRFNKAQQDAFLPHVESGLLTLVGATTENPSFALNHALLSRTRVVRLLQLEPEEVEALLRRALGDVERGLGDKHLQIDDEAMAALVHGAEGDARRALTALELASQAALGPSIGVDDVKTALGDLFLRYDKKGDEHYGVASAFIKSMRGSDPDAAIYWMMRMLEAGEDPLFVLRRMLIFASEDVGLADSRALMVVQAADDAYRRLGMPEGMYPLAHACLYLATAPKSNAANLAWHKAQELIAAHGALDVPAKLRPASNASGRALGHGKDYKYAHDYDGGVVPGETYLPEELVGTQIYQPTSRGEELRIKERLEKLRVKQSGES